MLARGSLSTRALPLGAEIREFAVAPTNPTGWALTSVICNGKLVGAEPGRDHRDLDR